MKMECLHADTCLPDYWGGHHLPHVSIPVYKNMELHDIKQELLNELNTGAIMGGGVLSGDDYAWVWQEYGEVTDAAYDAMSAAVCAIELKDGHTTAFGDLDESTEDDDFEYCDSVMAYFVFINQE